MMPHQEPVTLKYEILERYGEGVYGTVLKAIHRASGQYVAIKRIAPEEDEGVPATALREAALLRDFDHPNVVKLNDIIVGVNLYLVFEFVPKDLRIYLKERRQRSQFFQEREVQRLAHQLISGMAYCHSHRTLHRDLKPANILLTDDCCLKIADFGLARTFNVPIKAYTHEVVTLWYRPPEILLGSKKYNCASDMWSIGCIVGELMHGPGTALFQGNSEIGTIFQIFKALGTPTEDTWPGCTRREMLPDFCNRFPRFAGTGVAALSPQAKVSTGLRDLVMELLSCSPNLRLTALQALQHDYFQQHAAATVVGVPA